jgi:hypothetical protein
MCVCIYIYIYIHTHTHTHTHIYIYLPTWVYSWLRRSVRVGFCIFGRGEGARVWAKNLETHSNGQAVGFILKLVCRPVLC